MVDQKIIDDYEQYFLKPVVNKITLTTGKGMMLYDSDGKEYLDFTTGGGISILGYNNELTAEVKEAAIKQLRRLPHIPHYIYYSECAASYAEKLARATPGSLQKLFFSNSGSEAVEGAIRTSRKSRGRFELLALQQGFMGRTMGSVSLTGISRDKKGIGPLLPGVHHLPAPYCLRCSIKQTYPACGLACAEYLADYLMYGTCGDVAALVIEPILGDCGVVVPPQGYLGRMAELCREHGIALVIDETLTGFGRTGRLFASEWFDLKPDVMTLGKAIGGGLPLGALITTPQVAETFRYEDFSSTAGGNPVACAAGSATLSIIEREGLCQKAETSGLYLRDELLKIAARHPVIGQVRGMGLFLGIEIVDPASGLPDSLRAGRIKQALNQHGVLLDIFGPSSLRLTPPLIITMNEIDRFLEVFSAAIGVSGQALPKEG